MKPLGAHIRDNFTLVDLQDLKAQSGGSAGSRTARRNTKRLVRSLKRGERQKAIAEMVGEL
jgi:hypothetical protein